MVPGRLHREALAVGVEELEPDVEAEVDDPVDHHLARRAVRHQRHLEVVRPHEGRPDLVRLTDERHHELVGRLLVHVPRRADLLDVPLAHDDDLVGDLHRLLLVVRDDHRRRVRLVVQAAEPLAQLGPHLRVQRAERLVEEEHGRVDRERTGETHALPLPAGELCGIALREALELDELQELGDPLARSRPSAACGSSGRTRCCRTRSCA